MTTETSTGPSLRTWAAEEGWFRTWGFPLFLLLFSPPTTLLLWVCGTEFDGSLLAMARAPGQALAALPGPSWAAWWMFVAWSALQLALLQLLPGKRFGGPVTPMGNQAWYRLKGPWPWWRRGCSCSWWRRRWGSGIRDHCTTASVSC
jgi:hypothetical protein